LRNPYQGAAMSLHHLPITRMELFMHGVKAGMRMTRINYFFTDRIPIPATPKE
jgi:hypothetical protein